jgi:VWFA-related protein
VRLTTVLIGHSHSTQLFGALLIVAAAVPVMAQGQDYTYQTQSNLVTLPTHVQTRRGETLYGLRPEQFVVEDNGIRQAVHVDEDTDLAGLSLVVAVQCSRSAGLEFSKFKGLQAMIEGIVGNAPHEVAIVSYGDEPRLLGNFSGDPAALQLALSKLTPCHDFGAATLDTVNFATHLLERRQNRYRRAILLVSEIRDHGSQASAREAVASLGVTNTVIYSVAYSPTRDELIRDLRGAEDEPSRAPLASPPPVTATPNVSKEPPLVAEQQKAPKPPPLISLPPIFVVPANALRQNAAKELASLSGGEYINFTTERGFDEGLQRFSNLVHNYYLLSFQPRGRPDLGFHSLRVRIPEYPDAVIQTRTGYWSAGTSDAHSAK